MTNLKAYIVSDSNDNIRVANMTDMEFIEASKNKDEVSKLKAQIGELNKAETEA